jgi:dTDP-4-dehydrorhamnose reductase
MRVMVTGVTGQVGAALVSALAGQAELVPADRSVLDLTRPDAIGAALDRLDPDLIINPAAYTAVDRAEDERELAFRVNAEAPGAIARWASARAVPLIHFSTDYVFDGSGSRPWREDDAPHPLSVYGASKHGGETAVRAAGGPHLIVRTQWVYAGAGKNFFTTIERLARERKELRIVADQFGAPTSARVIAEAVASIVGPGQPPLAERFATAGGIVNVAASGETSWHGFAVAIVEGLRARDIALLAENIVAITTADYPTKARRPTNSRLDLTRLREVCAIEPPTWQQALAVELDRRVSA